MNTCGSLEMFQTGRPSEVIGTEQGEDVTRLAGKIADRACEVLAVHRTSFVKRYMQSDGHICIRLIAGGFDQYGFLVEAAPVAQCDGADTGIKSYSSWKNERVQKTAMFPGLVQLMEGDQQIIPSRIWLQRFDNALTDLGKPLYVSEGGVTFTASGGVKRLLGFPYGEIGIGRIGMPITSSKGTSEQIEAASDAMNDSAGLCIDNGIKRFNVGEAIKLFAGLRLGIYRDGIGLLLSPLNDTFRKSWDLGYGPIDCSFSV
jgi:hypothetical protein